MGFVKIHLAMFSAEKGNQHDRVTQLEARAVLLTKKKSPCVSSSHFLIVQDKARFIIKETYHIEKQHTLHLQAGKITPIKSIKAIKS